MDLELRHLRVIITLADELSFSRAADRLGLPQSALSSQLARIEKTLGVHLFDRTTRSVWPTPAGELLLPAARAAVSAAREFEDGARVLRRDTPGDLRVATDYELVAPLTEVLCQAAVAAVYTVTANALAAVCTGVADLAWAYDYPTPQFRPDRHVRCATVGIDPLWVALAPTHRLADEPTIRLADLADEPWAAGPAGSSGHEYLVELCRAAGFRPDIRYAGPMVAELVVTGSCVALASPLTAGNLHLVPLVPCASRRTVLAWNPARCPTATAEAVHGRLNARHQRLVADLAPVDVSEHASQWQT
ncbi:MAG TPA: LysR family transcriptional regulator [Pseudonocardiaceae bacterium]|nr:LysR family transcriptional regulator [Pseudonocardiaceae bacterium]